MLKKYHVDIKPSAENRSARRFAQIKKESPQNAVRWYLGLIEAIEKLDELAERCPIAPENVDVPRGIRHLIVGDYRVLYVIEDEVVSVLHVRHTRHERRP